MESESRRILIYDARCRLCVTAKEVIERSGSQDVRFVPYQTEEAAGRLGSAYAPGRPDAAFLVDQDGTIHRGLDAFAALLPGIRGGKLLLLLLRIPLIRPLGYLLYRLIARHRYRLFGEVTNRQ